MTETNKFSFPNVGRLLELNNYADENITIISIIGKTAFSAKGLKIKTLGRMFSRKISVDKATVNGYYDPKAKIIYLHAYTLLDSDMFYKNFEKICKEYQENQENDDFLYIFNEVRSSFAKTLFLLFHLSHIVVVSHPSSHFDTNYIQYFKVVESMSKSLTDKLSLQLGQDESLSAEWIKNGRPATPRIIFYFEKCPKGISNVKIFEHNLEDRIYQILRKARIISHNKSWCLFTVPMNEEFVYVCTEKPFDALAFAVKGLISDCQPGNAVQLESPFYDYSEDANSFQKFLQKHIDIAQNKGFDDVTSHFELPKLSNWVTAAETISEMLKEEEPFHGLCIESRFSEQRCLKVLPMALARYQEGLSVRYTSAMHETRLGFALALFSAQARGPMFQKYSEQLVKECTNYWENGRQLCEFLSLKGNPCSMPKDHSEDQEHNSGVLYIGVCDCGRKQGSREDPYNAKEANYVFYNSIGQECTCGKSERIIFPTFEKSVKDFIKSAEKCDKDEVAKPILPHMLYISIANEYLPEYSSWSLVYYGASSLYSHNMGLPENHQPGFWPNTNFLLPWDVQVHSKPQQNAEDQFDHHKHKQKDGKTKWQQFTVKVFIGLEYECPRGHRFMLAAPDKILKASPGSLVKDKGQRVAESDMPLYFACPCGRGTITITAQLMRLHVVTPKAAVHVKINPRVQPEANGPLFVPTLEGPSTLTQAAYWILRLPYMYFCENKKYPENQSARLLAGVFTVQKIEQTKEKIANKI